MDSVLRDIRRERAVQDEQWPDQYHSADRWLTILTEEVGEVAKAILSRNPTNLRLELIQVAAVATAILEAIDRGEVQ